VFLDESKVGRAVVVDVEVTARGSLVSDEDGVKLGGGGSGGGDRHGG